MDVRSVKLNVLFSTDFIKYPLTGIGRYAFELAHELQQREEKVALTWLHGKKMRDSLAVASESSQSIQSVKRKLQNSKTVS
ncbi:mannosyltransferase|nr:mannosyltransferase [Candidatus Pantoea persica]